MNWLRDVRDQVARQPALTVAAVLLVVSSLLSAFSGRMAYEAQQDTRAQARALQEQQEALERFVEETFRRECEQVNEGRADLRHAIADVLTDNLVENAQERPDPARVDRYQTGLFEDLVREFVDRDCGAEARERADR